MFKRLKNNENAKKNLTSSNNDDDDDESIYYTSKSKFDDKDKIETKPLNVFDYLKSLSQEAKDLMDEIMRQTMTLSTLNLFLLVVIRKNLTLTLGSH